MFHGFNKVEGWALRDDGNIFTYVIDDKTTVIAAGPHSECVKNFTNMLTNELFMLRKTDGYNRLDRRNEEEFPDDLLDAHLRSLDGSIMAGDDGASTASSIS